MLRRTLLRLGLVALPAPLLPAKEKVRVLCWSERTEPPAVYPNGINGALAEMLTNDGGVIAKIANLDDEGQGLSNAALAHTNVLFWFGHQKHANVTQDNVYRVVKRVTAGMGFVALHSAHYAHPFQEMLRQIALQKGAPLSGTPGSWGKVTNDGKPELIHILQPRHPITKGVKDFTIPKTETYANPFNIPAPDLKLLEGRYDGGLQDGNDGLLWKLGSGTVFYFRPGHETYPIYYQAEVRRILKNAAHFLAGVST